MRITMLGTAAAEGYPAVFCRCDNCERARRLGGQNIRRRAACLIDDQLLLDFGPDISASAQTIGISLGQLRYLLLTHAHDDHLLTHNLLYRRKKFCLAPAEHLSIYGSRPTLDLIRLLHYSEDALGIVLNEVHACDTWHMGPYTATALEARHAPQLESLFFAIQENSTCILYAADTGPFPGRVWDVLSGMRFDVAIIEATLGTSRASNDDDHHMTREQCIDHHKGLWQRGLMKPNGINIAHHFSHHGNPLHAELSRIFAQHGILAAYDGMVISV